MASQIRVKGYVCKIYDRNKRLLDWLFSSSTNEWKEVSLVDDELGKVIYFETVFNDIPRILPQFGFRGVIADVETVAEGILY